VPLTGNTANGGVIEGFAIPDKAESLPAGGTRTATFELTLADGSADSSVTGHPLKIETDLDLLVAKTCHFDSDGANCRFTG
jgi:hypothetical protein